MNKKEVVLCHYKFSNKEPVIFGLHTHQLTKNAVFDMHLSPEIGVVISGKMARYSGDCYFELTRGGVWMSGMLEPHGRQTLEPNSQAAVFIISPNFFVNTAIPGVDDQIWQKPFITPQANRSLLINEEFALLAERLLDFLDQDISESFKSYQVSLCLLEIILRVNQFSSFKSDNNTAATDYRRLQPALKLIFNSSEAINTAQAAQLCNLSSSRFSQLFSMATGQSFSKFALRHRLSQVARDLKNSNDSLDELADKWGFANKSHLVHRFKDIYKLTPAMYRNS